MNFTGEDNDNDSFLGGQTHGIVVGARRASHTPETVPSDERLVDEQDHHVGRLSIGELRYDPKYG